MSVRVLTPAARDIIDVTAKVISKVTEPSVRVDQHYLPRMGKPGVYDLCPGISTQELFCTLSKRLEENPEQLTDVDRYFRFAVWAALDANITDESQNSDNVNLPEDIPVKSAFASAHGDDDEEYDDNWELRTLFRNDASNDVVEMENDDF